jgi:hypothetical protein
MLIDFNKIDKQREESMTHYLIHLAGNEYQVPAELKSLRDNLQQHDLIHWVSDGKWSVIELFQILMEAAGPSDVYISSYAFSEIPARVIAEFKAKQIIKNLYCVVDSRIDVRSASALTLIQSCATKCKLLDTHAKVTVIENEKQSYTIVGSANYTTNNRYEAGFISCNKETADFHKKWISNELANT